MTEAEWLSVPDPAPLLRFAGDRLTDRLQLLFMAGCCRRIWNLLTDHRARRVVELAEGLADGRATADELEAAVTEVPGQGMVSVSQLWSEPSDHKDRGSEDLNPGDSALGGLGFHDLPTWTQQAYRAVAAIPPRGLLQVADCCETAVGDFAGSRVADSHPLHDEIRRLNEELRRGFDTVESHPNGTDQPHDEGWAIAYQAELKMTERMQVLANEIWAAGAGERVARTATERAAQTDLIRCLVRTPFRTIEPDPQWLTQVVRTLAAGIDADQAFDRLPILADALQDAGCHDPDVLAHCREQTVHTKGCWVVELLSPC